MKRSIPVLVVTSALLMACQAPPRSDSTEDVERVEQRLDFATGDVTGTVTWNGAPVSGAGARAMMALLRGVAGRLLSAEGKYQFVNVSPGEKVMQVFSSGCERAENKLAEANVTVNAASVSTLDFDITATAGRVTGRLLANGAPLSGVFLNTGNCSAWQSDGQGGFSMYLPPGTHSVLVIGSSGGLGSFSAVVVGGQTTALGDVALDSGRVSGTVSWNGTVVSGPNAQAMGVLTRGTTSAGGGLSASGTYLFDQVTPGPRTVELYSNRCFQPSQKLAETSVTVPAGGTATADFDIGAVAGQVRGTLTSNGAPIPGAFIQHLNCSAFRSDAQGRFTFYLPPGDHQVHIFGPTGHLGSTQFQVVAGSITDLGTVELPSGRLQGTVSWNGAPISGRSANAMLMSLVSLVAVRVGTDGKFVFPLVRPGTFTSQLIGNPCNDTAHLLRQAPVTITAGQTTTVDIDLAPIAGRVLGTIRVNGQPLPFPFIQVGNCTGWQGDAAGSFGMYLPAGNHTGRVIGQSGFIGQFDFAVKVGETTDVDIGTTPVGNNVEIELSGGLGTAGGVSLVFDNVVGAGNTTVVESGTGPAPPTGYRLVGLEGRPRYWDITSTATFTGTIKVCIQYDPAEVRTRESQLRLVHDEGSGFVDITASIDEAANVICGHTSSLSPFAIVEPERPDSDGDGTPDEEDNCPSAANSGQIDGDGDGQGDACDACPLDAGDDADADGLCVPQDNCQDLANADQADADGDQQGDACDADDDADGVHDLTDNCPLEANPAQGDADGDGAGDLCDADDDGDQVIDARDRCPGTAPAQVVDGDGCSIADRCPCSASWKSHGAYVSCVSRTGEGYVLAGLISEAEKDAAVSSAAQGACGVKK